MGKPTMKALTINQPWASLIACGAKTIETRSWCPPATVIGKRIAIHASKMVFTQGLKGSLREDWSEFFEAVENVLGYEWQTALPRGAVVATAVLESYWGIPTFNAETMLSMRTRIRRAPEKDNEFVFGDYTDGQVAWVLTDAQTVDPPFPARGYQKFWEIEPEWKNRTPAG